MAEGGDPDREAGEDVKEDIQLGLIALNCPAAAES